MNQIQNKIKDQTTRSTQSLNEISMRIKTAIQTKPKSPVRKENLIMRKKRKKNLKIMSQKKKKKMI